MLERIGKWIRNHIFNTYDCCYTDSHSSDDCQKRPQMNM